MTVSSGFFNSVNHDRLYDAEQLSSIFDGVIEDGVYQAIGDAFRVSIVEDTENVVTVGTGRAWFDHTWTVNDSVYSITLDSPNEALGRIDAIVLDVDRTEQVRKNTIKYIRGNYSESPQKPTLIKTDLHNQYPLAYITVDSGSSTVISNADIEIAVGTSECPLVIGVLESFNGDLFIQQIDAEFNEWWDGIKDVLDENTVTKLQNQINKLNEQVDLLYDKQIDFSVPKNIRLHYANYSNFPSSTYKNSRAFILPDGYLLLFNDGEIDMFPTNEPNDGPVDPSFICALMSPDGVVSQATVISDIPFTSDVIHCTGSCLIDENTDAYPASIIYLIPEDSNRTVYRYQKVTITVTESHIISVGTDEIEINLDLGVNSSYNATWRHISNMPVFLPEHNKVVLCTSSDASYTYIIVLFIDSDGVISTKTSELLIGKYGYYYSTSSQYIYMGYYNKITNTIIFPDMSSDSKSIFLNSDGTLKEFTNVGSDENGLNSLQFKNINWFKTDYTVCSGEKVYTQDENDPTKIVGEEFDFLALSGTVGQSPTMKLPTTPDMTTEDNHPNYTSNMTFVKTFAIPDSQEIGTIVSDPSKKYIIATSIRYNNVSGIKILSNVNGGLWSSYSAFKDQYSGMTHGFGNNTADSPKESCSNSLLLQKKCFWRSSDGKKIIIVIPGFVDEIDESTVKEVFTYAGLRPEVWLIEY